MLCKIVFLCLIFRGEGQVVVSPMKAGFYYETMGKALFEEGRIDMVIESEVKDFEKFIHEINETIGKVEATCKVTKMPEYTI